MWTLIPTAKCLLFFLERIPELFPYEQVHVFQLAFIQLLSFKYDSKAFQFLKVGWIKTFQHFPTIWELMWGHQKSVEQVCYSDKIALCWNCHIPSYMRHSSTNITKRQLYVTFYLQRDSEWIRVLALLTTSCYSDPIRTDDSKEGLNLKHLTIIQTKYLSWVFCSWSKGLKNRQTFAETRVHLCFLVSSLWLPCMWKILPVI